MKQVNPKSNYMWDSSNKKPDKKRDKLAYQKKLQEEKSHKIRKRMFYDELSVEEKNIDDKYRPELKTIKLNNLIRQNNYIKKQYMEWNIDEIFHYLICNSSTDLNTFQMTSILSVLSQKCKENLSTKKYALKNNGLNILLYVLSVGGDKNVATSNSVCRAITTLCEATNIVLKYPCEKQGVFYLCTAVRNSFKNPIFCCHAINCVVNFVKKNPIHRQYILTDKHNNKLILLIMEALELFRYAANHTKIIHCQKVQIAGCLALQNISAHPMGQHLVGPAGVEVILDTFVAFIDDDAVVSAALNALLNLCINNKNANAFLECEGLTFINTFLDNEYLDVKYRLSVCKIVHNMSCDPFLSRKLIDEYTKDCECVIMKLLAYAEYGTELYLAILRFLKTLLQEINKNKLEFMKDLLEQNFVQMLIDALEYDYSIEKYEKINNLEKHMLPLEIGKHNMSNKSNNNNDHKIKCDYKVRDIAEFIEQWVVENKSYNSLGTNCQRFAYEVFNFLIGNYYPNKVKILQNYFQSPLDRQKEKLNRLKNNENPNLKSNEFIQHTSIQSNGNKSNTIQSNSIQTNIIQSNSIQSNKISDTNNPEPNVLVHSINFMDDDDDNLNISETEDID
eukprot:442297_1